MDIRKSLKSLAVFALIICAIISLFFISLATSTIDSLHECHVKGRLFDDLSNAIPGEEIRIIAGNKYTALDRVLERGDTPRRLSTVTDTNGNFELNFASTAFRLEVVKEGFEYYGRVFTLVGGHPDSTNQDLTIYLERKK